MVNVEADVPATAFARDLAAAFPDHHVRAGLSSVLVEADEPDAGLLDAVTAVTARIDLAGTHVTRSGRLVEIPVIYNGDDLSVVASALACSPAAVVAAHQEQEWSVAMMGFAPGFAYLLPTGAPLLPWGAVDRRDRPRAQVPARSVALAAGMSAVYPEPMPGGWHLIGMTTTRLFDPTDILAPTLLQPDDVVRFREERG